MKWGFAYFKRAGKAFSEKLTEKYACNTQEKWTAKKKTIQDFGEKKFAYIWMGCDSFIRPTQ